MFGYYVDLALRSMKRNAVLTALMVTTLAVGIGACITTLTVYSVLSGDPLPDRSARLFYPRIDPVPEAAQSLKKDKPASIMTYTDAMNLVRARKAQLQAAMALATVTVSPQGASSFPFKESAIITTPDFFAMFDAPFQYGGGWSAADGANQAHEVVIAKALNDKLYGGKDSVGQTVQIDKHDFRIAGVLKHWAPEPRFYALDLGPHTYGDGDGIFMPLQTALSKSIGISPINVFCFQDNADMSHLQTAPCAAFGVWVQLERASDATAYRRFLSDYVQEQIAAGRMHYPAVSLRNLTQRLSHEGVVPQDVRLQVWLAFGFLLICVVNTVGLLLAKCLRRAREIGVRRALGASRRHIFAQFMVEAGLIGIAGGLLGLGFAELGVLNVRHQPTEYASLAHMHPCMFALTFLVALAASLFAGLLPAWRACTVAPAPQIKST